jgi:hypothetical protein
MNLVYLRQQANGLRITDKQPNDVTIYKEKGTWTRHFSLAGNGSGSGTEKIGDPLRLTSIDSGTIGVFDADNLEHLRQLVRVAIRAAAEHPQVAEHPINPRFYEGPFGGG